MMETGILYPKRKGGQARDEAVRPHITIIAHHVIRTRPVPKPYLRMKTYAKAPGDVFAPHR